VNVDEYVEKLELQKNDVGFYKCPFCDYVNADPKVVRKHVKSKHIEEVEKEIKKLESQKSKSKNNNGKKQKGSKKQDKSKQPKRVRDKCVNTQERKDYVLFFCHNRRVRLHLANGEVLEGKCCCKDPYTVLVDVGKGDVVIVNKAYIVMYVPLDLEKL
jgi:sRNA-binding regulator protein Hfq